MSRRRYWLLALLGMGCSGRAPLSPAELDRIHGICEADIAKGTVLTRRTRDIGLLPAGTATQEGVVIYGADWCRACHIAKDYLARRGIPFIAHDVEADPDARTRLDRTLELAALPQRKVLPVLEVRGTVTLGFMPCVVESVWRRRPGSPPVTSATAPPPG